MGPLPERLQRWQESRNHLAIGNLGEQVTGRLLMSLGYHLLGSQDDFLGMVSQVLGEPTHAHPEDFIAIDPNGRLMTINSKASISPRSCRTTHSGDLSVPRLGRSQNQIRYATYRANLISPLDGESFAQVVKVDLLHLKAQIFEIGNDGRLFRLTNLHEISDLVRTTLEEYPDSMPPPNIWDLA